jgi:hypothetical protein
MLKPAPKRRRSPEPNQVKEEEEEADGSPPPEADEVSFVNADRVLQMQS